MDKWLSNLKSELNRRNISYGLLSKMTGLSVSTISRWFNESRYPEQRSRESVEVALGWKQPRRGDPSGELQRALYAHPYLSDEETAFFWDSIRLKIEDNRRQAKNLEREERAS